MNTEKELSLRLLSLFPTRLIKEHFGCGISEVLNRKNHDSIKNFALNNINNTKQHVFILELKKNFNSKSFKVAGFPIEIYKNDIPNGSLICSHTIEFSVKIIHENSNSVTKSIIKFIQPILISFLGKHIIVQMTILEKNLNHYVNGGKVFEPIRNVTEDEIITQICSLFLEEYDAGICDINKGIKFMWENDLIDSKHVKWKKKRSTAIETMDEEYTVKQQYPDLYKSLIQSPLNKTLFKYLLDDGELVEHFTAEPSYGTINIPIFPKNSNQINNVINKIISNN
ncbi:MAG TPA: hypothetical protein PLC65_20195 [Bacteroidia bacterium]|nr:hypothetical protein [Bacteroidia bacterium]